jgi:hypothetical protein
MANVARPLRAHRKPPTPTPTRTGQSDAAPSQGLRPPTLQMPGGWTENATSSDSRGGASSPTGDDAFKLRVVPVGAGAAVGVGSVGGSSARGLNGSTTSLNGSTTSTDDGIRRGISAGGIGGGGIGGGGAAAAGIDGVGEARRQFSIRPPNVRRSDSAVWGPGPGPGNSSDATATAFTASDRWRRLRASRSAESRIRRSSLANLYGVFVKLEQAAEERFLQASVLAVPGGDKDVLSASRADVDRFREVERTLRDDICSPGFKQLSTVAHKLVVVRWLQALWRFVRTVDQRKKQKRKRFQLAKWWQQRNSNASPVHHPTPTSRRIVSRRFRPWGDRRGPIDSGGGGGGGEGRLRRSLPPPGLPLHPDANLHSSSGISNGGDTTAAVGPGSKWSHGGRGPRRPSAQMRRTTRGLSMGNLVEIRTSDKLCVCLSAGQRVDWLRLVVLVLLLVVAVTVGSCDGTVVAMVVVAMLARHAGPAPAVVTVHELLLLLLLPLLLLPLRCI